MPKESQSQVTPSELSPALAESVEPSACGCGGAQPANPYDDEQQRVGASNVAPSAAVGLESAPAGAATQAVAQPTSLGSGERVVSGERGPSSVEPSGNGDAATRRQVVRAVAPSGGPPTAGGLVYSFGTLGYDFGTEARRDSFKQLMPPFMAGDVELPANPHDARQMVDYLKGNLPETKELIWTLNLELTPIYALHAVGPFSREVFEVFTQLLDGEVLAEDDENFVERVSIPGHLTGQNVRLFSGQIVPLISVDNTRGIYGWKVNTLVNAAIAAVKGESGDVDEEKARKSLANFLNRVYYDLRNLGQTSQERAINFAATNAFQVAATFSEAIGAGMELSNVTAIKSPFCRMDSDCWDIVLTFFDETNLMRARKLFRFTIDVSDVIPVTLGKVRSWSTDH